MFDISTVNENILTGWSYVDIAECVSKSAATRQESCSNAPTGSDDKNDIGLGLMTWLRHMINTFLK